jgi:hypothetical protein
MFGGGLGAKTAQGFDPMGGFGPYQVVGFGNKKAGGPELEPADDTYQRQGPPHFGLAQMQQPEPLNNNHSQQQQNQIQGDISPNNRM